MTPAAILRRFMEAEMTNFRIRTVALGAVSTLTRGGFISLVREADKQPYDTMP
jgi:hypothetical protein